MTPNIDLHMHTHYSDGELSPEALVSLAAEHGVEVMALTDHDTLAGLYEAREAATQRGIRFINGVEISCLWQTHDIHIVALDVEPEHEPLQRAMQQQEAQREERAKKMGERLAACGIENAYEGARDIADKPIIGRPHFAKYLVQQGVVKDIPTAFKRYLSRGKPAYVATDWASLSTVVEWIKAAGGIAVLAHPLRYKFTMSRVRKLIDHFKESGGVGIEVVTSRDNRDEIQLMSKIANEKGLFASMGSDFHGPSMHSVQLGRLAALPPDSKSIWELLAL